MQSLNLRQRTSIRWHSCNLFTLLLAAWFVAFPGQVEAITGLAANGTYEGSVEVPRGPGEPAYTPFISGDAQGFRITVGYNYVKYFDTGARDASILTFNSDGTWVGTGRNVIGGRSQKGGGTYYVANGTIVFEGKATAVYDAATKQTNKLTGTLRVSGGRLITTLRVREDGLWHTLRLIGERPLR
jgi:hypothetical protein